MTPGDVIAELVAERFGPVTRPAEPYDSPAVIAERQRVLNDALKDRPARAHRHLIAVREVA
jgi:hypothetical protein